MVGERCEEDGGGEDRDPGLVVGMRRTLGEGRREALPSRSVSLYIQVHNYYKSSVSVLASACTVTKLQLNVWQLDRVDVPYFPMSFKDIKVPGC